MVLGRTMPPIWPLAIHASMGMRAPKFQKQTESFHPQSTCRRGLFHGLGHANQGHTQHRKTQQPPSPSVDHARDTIHASCRLQIGTRESFPVPKSTHGMSWRLASLGCMQLVKTHHIQGWSASHAHRIMGVLTQQQRNLSKNALLEPNFMATIQSSTQTQ